MHKGAGDGLEQDQDVEGQADVMMRVRQAAPRADGEPTEHEDHGRQRHGDDLQPDMQAQGPAGSAAVEARRDYGRRDDDDEDDGREDGVSADQGMILGEPGKSVSHSCRGSPGSELFCVWWYKHATCKRGRTYRCIGSWQS